MMNDFTKEELEIIRDGLLWRDIKTMPRDRPFDLQFKVKKMIANYCEHELESCCDCSIINCKKCDAEFGRDKRN